jgi:glycerol-3-phosphate O-acyltransferase/dihydroxyacetone phosphate acyltransferase
MALGALSADPDCGLTIIPCGMNYFHAHKFRSRAVVEFGTPVEVPANLIELYKTGDRRAAVGKLLDDVYNALVSVTVTAPDYDTLMVSYCAFLACQFTNLRTS